MKRRLLKVMDRIYDVNIEGRIALLFSVSGVVIAIIGFFLNDLIGLDFIKNSPTLALFFLCLASAAFIYVKGSTAIARLTLIFLSFFYCPYTMTLSGGINGAMSAYIILIVFVNTIVFRKRQKTVMSVAYVCFYVGYAIWQYNNPDRVVPYPSDYLMFLDFTAAYALTITSTILLVAVFASSYTKDYDKTQLLIQRIEEQNRELSELSIRDPLTGIYNRRHLMSTLAMELESHNDGNDSLCVIMMDIDYFKKVNDEYGHGFGDEVLRETTTNILKFLRSYDVFARYGGEEFAIILPKTTSESAYSLSERIRKSIEQMTWRFDLKITFSFGIARYVVGDSEIDLIERADTCLYQAKRTGRNKTVFLQYIKNT